MLCVVGLTQYWRVTDGRTDRQTNGNAIASTVLAMQALRRAVKNELATEPSRRFRHFAATELLISLFLSFMPTKDLDLFFYAYPTKTLF